jgi:4-hydroxy-tetrahydrodipicolinate synthase
LNNTKAVGQLRQVGFDVFAGSESFLLQNMRNGGAGCITAGANVNLRRSPRSTMRGRALA